MNVQTLLLSVLLSTAVLLPALADDIADQIDEAAAAYARKDVPTAIAGLEAALNLLRQSRADAYGRLLPGPLAGWTADEIETISIGAILAGGGTGASRKYHKGDEEVTVSIMADSPMLQALSAFASSGMAAMAGARTQIVNGRRMIYLKDDSAYTSIVADRILVRVEGKGVTEASLRQYLSAIDFGAVEKVAR